VSLAAFIATQRAQYGIPHAVACRAVGVSQAWFYKWRKGDVSLRRKRRAAVDAAVAYEFARRQGRDGSPPITVRLRDAGWRISKNTVADSMRRQGLVARPKRRRRGLTKADRRARKPADRVGRDFAPPARINQRWVSDLTEAPTDEGVLYLASILDLASRRVVGYALGEHHDADLAAAAVQVAIATRGGQVAGVVLHTDQGGEFSGGALVRVCAAAGIVQSMGRTGSALDNAAIESWHSTLEFELRSRHRFTTREQARRAVVAWIEEYNTDRLHSTNGMISPVDYENGRRRPDAKTYAQLRRHRHRVPASAPVVAAAPAEPANTPSEAATPPAPSTGTLRGGHRRRAVSGPAPPASRAATALATATPYPPAATAPAGQVALDPGASTGPGRQHQGQARACPPRTRDATTPRSLSTKSEDQLLVGLSTVPGD
jgi:putative transposase